jgi:hypothetical protein
MAIQQKTWGDFVAGVVQEYIIGPKNSGANPCNYIILGSAAAQPPRHRRRRH